MNRLQSAFINNKAFIGFLTAGDPSFEKTEEFILSMVKGGMDVVEVGIPFSDPVAEGPIVQAANIRALKAGATVDGVLTMIDAVRKKSSVPIVLLTYLNPVFSYGYEQFFARCEEVGVDGIIIPDLPYEEKNELLDTATAHGVDVISLIAPFSKDRIRMIAKTATGYAYIMPPPANNSCDDLDEDLVLKTVHDVTKTPAVIEIDESSIHKLHELTKNAEGYIIGNVFVKLIEKYKNDASIPLFQYVKSIKDIK